MPASTRSKTGKLPQTSKHKTATTPDDSDSDDPGSERPTQKETKERAQPLKNRAKKNDAAPHATGSSTKTTTHKKTGDLSNLPEMPLDILRYIFALRPPDDLVRISRATKGFREVLSSTAFDGLWRESFEHVESPPRPPDVSHHEWANIVYGGPFCHCCGRNTPAKIIFEFRKRMCSECVKTRLLRTSDIIYPKPLSSYKGWLINVHSLAPVITSPGHNSKTVCEWPVLKAVFNRLVAQSEDVSKASYGVLQDRLTSLVQVEKNALEIYTEHVKKCNEWQERLLQKIQEERQEIANERKANILGHFIEMGYTEAEWDESGLSSHKEVDMIKPLTDKGASLPTLQVAREELHRKEQAARRANRQSVAAKMYPGLLASLVHPTEFPLMPTRDQCLTIKFVTDFLDVDADTDDEWRAKAKKMFVAMVELVREDILAQKKKLVVLLPRPDDPSPEDPNVIPGINDLDLARSVFQVVATSRYYDAGDSRDSHFGAGVLSRASRSSLFRTSKSPEVNHITMSHSAGPVDSFRLLAEDELADILPKELGLRADSHVWGCCHCPMDEDGPYWMCKSEALAHLKLKHKISEPVENTDIFFNPCKEKACSQWRAILRMPKA
ncbi:hypothetical protein OF83DRAFT_1084912 [Amylostereum chailletii]|nr:hypothetical protein OF83DRAFT_1084912 [Amylostereum chailletii]